jgi:hypothetical protein
VDGSGDSEFEEVVAREVEQFSRVNIVSEVEEPSDVSSDGIVETNEVMSAGDVGGVGVVCDVQYKPVVTSMSSDRTSDLVIALYDEVIKEVAPCDVPISDDRVMENPVQPPGGDVEEKR